MRQKRSGSFVVTLSHHGSAMHYVIDVQVSDYGDKLRIQNGPAFDNLMDVCTVYINCLVASMSQPVVKVARSSSGAHGMEASRRVGNLAYYEHKRTLLTWIIPYFQ